MWQAPFNFLFGVFFALNESRTDMKRAGRKRYKCVRGSATKN
jgi:hypothetical protein